MNEKVQNEQGQESEEPKDQAQSDFESGKKFLLEGSFGQAANAFHNALLGFEEKGNEPGIANANDKLGDICRERNEFEKSLGYYARAQEICERHEDVPSVVALLKKKAFCHRNLDQRTETLALYFKLLDIYSDWKNPALSVEILSDIAGLYAEMDERQKAAEAYRAAAAIHQNYGHTIIAKELFGKADSLLAV